jgi:hypothetical protein
VYLPSVPGAYAFTVHVKDTLTARTSGDTPPLTFTFAG